MSVKTEVINDKFLITCPYEKAFIAEIKKLGGRWHAPQWVVDVRQKERAEDVLLEIFGENGTDEPVDTVDIKLTGTEWNDSETSSTLKFCNRVVAYRPGRDSRVRFGSGVVVVEAEFPETGGSAKYPSLCMETDCPVFEVYNVPRAVYEKIKDINGVELLPAAESKELQLEKLKSERDKLKKMTGEIDKKIVALSSTKFDFKTRLRAEVERSGLTQRAFAECMGVPLRTFESWIYGKRTPQAAFTRELILEKAKKVENQPKED